ncbi:MAG: FAD-dependent oxidoreductase [Azoarcus sp.]|nr:FAD-dependent oxidoreductase [Azoarcus sp.]
MVVGGGHAAGELAVSLRQEGYTGRILIVGAESHLPYQRPPLSKAFLSGKVAQEGLAIRPAVSYEKAAIDLSLSTKIVRIDRAGSFAVSANGEEIPYDRLVLATGGRARQLTVPGWNGRGVFSLRTIDDVLRIRREFKPGRRLVIIGAGYVGLEVAAVAIQCGLHVTVLEAAERVLARVVAPQLSAFYEQVHRRAGVEIRTGTEVVSIDAETVGTLGLLNLRCSDGTALGADLVLVGIGLVPNTELAEAAGLDVDNGIVVDEFARSSDPKILAIGDCANHFNEFAGRRMRLESVQNAIELARTAAATLCGKVRPYRVIPWFWSDQYHLKLQMAGLSHGYQEMVLRGTFESESFICFYLQGGRVIAADAVNRPADFMHTKRLIAEGGTSLSAHALADESCSLKIATGLLPA